MLLDPPGGGFKSTCTALQSNTDPFSASSPNGPGEAYPADTEARCQIDTNDFGTGGLSARLLDVCSYPSDQPNSDPSDCVVTPNAGFLTLKKVADPDDSAVEFVFQTSRAAYNGQTSFSIYGSGDDPLNSFAPGLLDVTELVPDGWRLDNAECRINGTVLGSFDRANNRVDGTEIRAPACLLIRSARHPRYSPRQKYFSGHV